MSSDLIMPTTILVVDDTLNVRMLLRDHLAAEGYKVVTANNGRDALIVARHEMPDLILLDIMMPEMGGYEFIRHYRQEKSTPIILLTAKIEESDKVVGLELGADDYLTKPFGMRELVARIRAVLRRTIAAQVTPDVLRVADIVLETHTRQVVVGEREVQLTPTEFDLLAIFMLSPGQVFTRTILLEKLQGNSYEGVERTVDVHIRNLRSKVEPDASSPRYIETVFGVGYRMPSD